MNAPANVIKPNEWDVPTRLLVAETVVVMKMAGQTNDPAVHEFAHLLGARLISVLLGQSPICAPCSNDDVLDFIEWWYTTDPVPPETIES